MVLLNNKITTLHYLFTESIDKQQPLFNLLQYIIMGVGEGYCELPVNFVCRFHIYSTCNFAIPCAFITGMREREVSRFSNAFKSKS